VRFLSAFSILLRCVHDEDVKVHIFRESDIEYPRLPTSLVLPSWSVLVASSATIASNINPPRKSISAEVDLMMLTPQATVDSIASPYALHSNTHSTSSPQHRGRAFSPTMANHPAGCTRTEYVLSHTLHVVVTFTFTTMISGGAIPYGTLL